ncbi:hypothetical protein ACFVAJ_16415 [Agromyces sp. NPDC057679]|uniref:hypothetical protein n=1 Tax=Agromyces sp. NPDC057679 TaxID=3346207 RepID=UPI00366DB944
MNPKAKLWLVIASGVVVAAVIFVAVMAATAPSSPGKTKGKEGSAWPTVVATLPPAPTESAIPGDDPHTDPDAPGKAGSGVDKESSGDHDKSGETADWSAVKDVAGKAVMEFSRVIDGESAAARTARLAPYIEDGSPLLTSEPEIGNPWGYVNVKQTNIIWRGDPVSGVNGEANGNYQVMTVAPYNAVYVVNEQSTDVVNTGKWDVLVSKKTGKVTSIVEPSILY